MKRFVKIVFFHIITYCLIMTITTCKKDEDDNGGSPAPVNRISFNGDIQPIFNNSCNACHPPSAGLDLSAGNSYQSLTDENLLNTSDPESSGLYQKIVNGHQGNSSTAADHAMILAWIQDGAEDN